MVYHTAHLLQVMGRIPAARFRGAQESAFGLVRFAGTGVCDTERVEQHGFIGGSHSFEQFHGFGIVSRRHGIQCPVVQHRRFIGETAGGSGHHLLVSGGTLSVGGGHLVHFGQAQQVGPFAHHPAGLLDIEVADIVFDTVFVAAQGRVDLVQQPLVYLRRLKSLELEVAVIAVVGIPFDKFQNPVASEQFRIVAELAHEPLPVLAHPRDMEM